MADFFTHEVLKPEVSLISPTDSASVSSPVAIQASAFPPTGHAITGWRVYVDNVSKYSAGAVTAIDHSIAINAGKHTLVVRAWDDSGAFGDQTFSLTLLASEPMVTIAAPANLASVGSNVNVKASAKPTSGHTITGWRIYVDGVSRYNAGPLSAINTTVAMSAGVHTVIARAWDTSSAYADQTLTVTVSSNPTVSISKPASGSKVSSPVGIHASATKSSERSITGWKVYLDGVAAYTGGAVDSISPKLRASVGTHTLVVRVWDSARAYGDQTIHVTIP
jgi:hypothetical protein